MENQKIDALIEKVRELSQEFPDYKVILAMVISEANKINSSKIPTENMEKQIKQVEEFHKVFKQEMSHKPSLISEKDYLVRYNLGLEELKEYADACEANDLVEILDSLADQLYILLGTAVKHGLQYKLGEAFDLVHHNNMTKLDANGEPILRADGKILKPEGFVPVKLNHLLEEEVKNG